MSDQVAPTLSALITYILERSEESDLDRIRDALRQRGSILRQRAAAAITEGCQVITHSLKPRYLNDLAGIVKNIENIRGNQCAVITLDEESVAILAFATSKFAHILGKKAYDLTGVPLICCKLIDD